MAQLVHGKCHVCSVLTEEQASGHVRSVLADLFWVQLHWILVFHIVNCWGLHCVPILEPQTLKDNVNVPEVVLMQHPCLSLSPTYYLIQRLDALWRTRLDDARFAWVHALQLLLELRPVTTKSSPCVKPEVFLLLLWTDKFLELRPSSQPQFSSHSRSHLLAASLVPYMLFFNNPISPLSFSEQSSAGYFTSTSLSALAWKYARETCLNENSGL